MFVGVNMDNEKKNNANFSTRFTTLAGFALAAGTAYLIEDPDALIVFGATLLLYEAANAVAAYFTE